MAAAHEASAEPGSGSPLPAGRDPRDARPTALRRGQMRKRLRFLERQRELLLRDLGGLVYEIHRTGAPADREHHRGLVSSKIQRLAALDVEHGAGLGSLRDTRGDTVLREPGVGGLCLNCGEFLGSDARFCSVCGTRVDAVPGAAQSAPQVAAPEIADLALPTPGSPQPAPAPTPDAARPAVAVPPGDDPITMLRQPATGEDPITESGRPATGDGSATGAELRRPHRDDASDSVAEVAGTASGRSVDPVPELDRPAPERSADAITEIDAEAIRPPDRRRP